MISMTAGNGLKKPPSPQMKGARAMKSSKQTSLLSKVEAYFAACDATAERIVLKNGSVTVRQTPYTLAGLSEHLGIPQSEILDKAKRESGSAEGGCCAAAVRRIGRYIAERALLGELQYSVAAKLLDELGIDEKLPPDESEKRIVIVMEDKEDWSE